MAIEINNLTNSRPSQVSNDNRQPTVGRQEPPVQQQETSGKGSSTETVSMTDAAVNLKKMSKQMKKMPVVETKRVEEIRKAIENGDFEIDELIIADKLIGMEKLLQPHNNERQ